MKYGLLALTAILLLIPATRGRAATLSWDADTTDAAVTDGNGVWDSLNTNWWDGAANTNWTGANPDSALFGAAGGTGEVTLAEAITVSNLTFAGSYLIQSNVLTLSAASTFTANSNATIRSGLAGSSLVKMGPATLTLGGTNTFTGPVSVNEGTLNVLGNLTRTNGGLVIATGAVVQSAGTLFLNVGSPNPSIGVSGGGVLQLTATGHGPSTPDLVFAANRSGTTYWGARLAATLDLGSTQRYIHGYTSHNGVGAYGVNGADCQFAGPISGSGGLTFFAQMTYTAANPMEVPFCLNSTNSFTGPVEIQRGSVYLGSAGALTNGNVLKFNAAAGNNARFFLWGRNAVVSDLQSPGPGQAVIADGAVAGASAIGPATLEVRSSNSTSFGGTLADYFTEYGNPAGALTARLSLVKSGPATLTLTGTNTYAGPTTISEGALVMAGSGRLGGGSYAAALTNDGLFNYASAATQTLGGALSGTGSVLKTGGGLLILTGDNSYEGGTTVSGGTLRVDNASGSGTGSGPVDMAAGSLLTGRGTIAGPVGIRSGGQISAESAGVGQLTLGSLALSGGSTALVEVASDGSSNDLLLVSNADGLTNGGCAFLLFTNGANGAWSPSTTNTEVLNLIQFTGAIADTGTWRVANPVVGVAYTFQTNGAFLQLVIQQRQAMIWSGTSPSGANWSDATNWAGGTAPTDLNVLTFGDALQTDNTNDLPAHTRVAVVFTNGAPPFTLSGQALDLLGDIENLSGSDQTLNLPLVLNSGVRALNASNGNLILSGTIGQTNGSWGLRVIGGGTVFLTGSNQYGAAALTVTNGHLSVNMMTIPSTRPISLSTGSVFTSTNTINLAGPPAGDTALVRGPGVWQLRAPASSLSAPDIFYSPEGLLGNYGAIVTAPIDTGAGGPTRYIRGNANRNDFYRYFGDWQEQGGFTGSGDLHFYGVPQGDYEMTFTLAADNSRFTGGVTLQRGDLVLYNNLALTASNRVHLNPGAGENAYLHPWGNGFSLHIGSLSSGGGGNARVISHYSQTLTIHQTSNGVFAGSISNETGVLKIVKDGPATLTLSAVNGFAGGTQVSNGQLTVNGTLGSGGVEITAGATLAGRGAVGIVTNAGQVAPGDAGTESLTLAAFQALPGSTVSVELAGATVPGTDHDQLIVTGNAALDGTLNVSTNGYVPVDGDTFTVLSAGSFTGSFAATNLPPLAPGLYWNVQYNPSTVMLVVTQAPALTGYNLWAQSITNEALRGYDADADGDGYANLLEYSQGTDPTNGTDRARVVLVKTGEVYALKFNFVTSAVDLVYHVEASYALTNNTGWEGIKSNYLGEGWTGDTTVTFTNVGPVIQIFAEDNDPGVSGRGIRLRVERPAP